VFVTPGIYNTTHAVIDDLSTTMMASGTENPVMTLASNRSGLETMIRVGESGALSVENVNILYTILVENNVELFRIIHSSSSLSFSGCEF
jgi:hypothetical protein